MTKLFRSRVDSRLGGVCGGLAESFEIDSNIVRLLFFAAIFTPLPIILFYLGCWIILPKRPL